MKENLIPVGELEQRLQSLPLSVRCYFEWEKEKRDAPLSERIQLVDLQERVRERWNPQELGQFYSFLSFQQDTLKAAFLKGITNGRK